ncbi:MAG: hypothetical protein RL272_939 [Candidatus Parcubacteria bacterium]|jgi:uncharacterized membrane protein YhaH (DUF805 family)
MANQVIGGFSEKPRTKTAWWAMGLGLGALCSGPFLGIFGAVISPAIAKAFGDRVAAGAGVAVAAAALAMTVSAFAVGIRAFRIGERSWVLWLGFVPAVLGCAFWVFTLVGEFLFPH